VRREASQALEDKPDHQQQAGMDKYRKVVKPKETQEGKSEEEIRLSATGSISSYVTRAAKVYNELEKPKVVIQATGNALTKAVQTAEVIKRRFKGLHQITKLENHEIVDVFEPLEEGLDTVTETRSVPYIEITLSKEPLDTSDKGYQPPIDESLVTDFDPEKMKSPRGGGGRGGRGKKTTGRGDSEAKGKGLGKEAPNGKGKGKEKGKEAAAKGKGKGKGDDKGAGKGKDKGKGKGKGDEDKDKGKGKMQSKGKMEPWGKGKSKGYDDWDYGFKGGKSYAAWDKGYGKGYKGYGYDDYKGGFKGKGFKGGYKGYDYDDYDDFDYGYKGGFKGKGPSKGSYKGDFKGKDSYKGGSGYGGPRGMKGGKGDYKGKGKYYPATIRKVRSRGQLYDVKYSDNHKEFKIKASRVRRRK